VTWRRLIGDSGDQPGEGERRGLVKYDTPKFEGFTGTTSWGEDDYWDIGLRYAGEFGGIKIAAAIAYGENTDITSTTQGRDAFFECLYAQSDISDAKCHQVGGSLSVMDEKSGLYANFAAGQLTDELIQTATSNATRNFAGTGADDTSSFWAVEGGIEKKWFDLGKTTLFAQYYDHDGGANNRMRIDGADPINPHNGNSRIWSTGVEMVGGGVIQEISAAAMLLYVYYRHYEADLEVLSGTTGPGVVLDAQLDDLDIVMSGAMIKF
jgi:hypothetical protein